MSETTKETSVDEAKAAKKKAQRAQKSEAFEFIKFIADKSGNEKFIEALKVVRPSMYGIARSGGSSSADKFIAFINEHNQVGEDRVFKEFKIGRKDCAGYIRKHLKTTEPANRVWIDFNPSNGLYKVSGKGANPPKDWKGFIPVAENVNL